MVLKIRITETMRGQHHFVDPELGEPLDRSLHFRIDWSGEPKTALNPLDSGFMTFDAAGVIDVEGLTKGEIPCAGSLRVDYFRGRTITYELDFEANGDRFRYVGQKVGVNLLRPVELIKTHTTCYGTITREDGRIVSKSVTHFEPDELVPFVASFRVLAG
jgi:hypothetical protein